MEFLLAVSLFPLVVLCQNLLPLSLSGQWKTMGKVRVSGFLIISSGSFWSVLFWCFCLGLTTVVASTGSIFQLLIAFLTTRSLYDTRSFCCSFIHASIHFCIAWQNSRQNCHPLNLIGIQHLEHLLACLCHRSVVVVIIPEADCQMLVTAGNVFLWGSTTKEESPRQQEMSI